MTQFITDRFMLQNTKAVELYNKYAKDMPIYDYHCHLDPQQISENTHFDNITTLWLGEIIISGERCVRKVLMNII